MIRTSEQIDKIAPALIAASKKIKHAEKNASNSHFNNSYATLEASIDATKDHLLEQGIAVMQAPVGRSLTTRLQHSSGQFYEFDTELILSKNDMQGYGSAVSYARRQALNAVTNISQKDDDATAASKKQKVARVVTKSPIKKDSLQF